MSLPVFWGLQLSPGQTLSPQIEHHVRITTASFGKKVQKDSRSTVYLKIADKEFAVCNLSESKIESISCDIVIPIESEPSFRVTGNNAVYLTGQILHPQEEEEVDSDSEDEAIRQLLAGEDISDDDDDASFDGEDSDEDLPEGVDMDDDSEESDEDDKILEQHLQKLLKKNSKASDRKEIPTASKKVEQSKKVEAPQESKKSKKNDTPVKPINGEAKPSKNDKKPEASKPAETNGKRKNETEAPKNKKNKPEVKAPAKVEKKEEPKTTIKTLPSGLKIEDRLVGTGAEAKRNNRVLVRYIGRLKNGKVFDQNSSGAPFCFRLGAGEVIKGWDQGVLGMRIGGQRKLTIPSPLAYGSRGAPPDIPKNAELNFEIKLMGIK